MGVKYPTTALPNGKIKRSLLAHFLYTNESDASTATVDTFTGASISGTAFARLGQNVTDLSVDYSAQTETSQDIISDSATTDITGYQPTTAVSQQCTKGDPVFTFVNKLRRKRAVLSEAHTWMLNVDVYDGTASAGFVGELQQVAVQIDTYGGAGGETPTLDFTLNYIGDAVPVTVKINENGTVDICADDYATSATKIN